MHAKIGTVKEPELRVKIVEQRAEFDSDPQAFKDMFKDVQQSLTDKLDYGRTNLKNVSIDNDLKIKISQICSELDVDGLRGDIVTNRAALALTAFDKRDEVTPKDIYTVISLCLRHRLRKDPLESIDSGYKVQETFRQVFGFV